MRVSMPSEVFALCISPDAHRSPSEVLCQQLTNFATSSMTRWLLAYLFRVVFVEMFT